MDAYGIVSEYMDLGYVDDEDIIEALCEYIDNQKSLDAFEDFLKRWTKERKI